MVKILERIFRLVEVGGQVYAKFIAPVIGIIFANDDDYRIYVSSAGDLWLITTKAGKGTYLVGTTAVFLRVGTTTVGRASSTGVYCEAGLEMGARGSNGSVDRESSVVEELTIPVGQGSLGVDTTAFIPEYSRAKAVGFIVTQAPGGGATSWDACLKGDGNACIANAQAVALSTSGDNIKSGDGNWTTERGIGAAIEITVTTDFDVTVSDMKIRFVVFYEKITAPTS